MYKVTPVKTADHGLNTTAHALRGADGKHMGRYMAVGKSAKPNLLTVPLVGERVTPQINSDCNTLYKLSSTAANGMQFFVGSRLFVGCDSESLQPRANRVPMAPHKQIASQDLPSYFYVASDWNPTAENSSFGNATVIARRVRDMVSELVNYEGNMSATGMHAHSPMHALLQHVAGGSCTVQSDARSRTLKLKPEQSPPDMGAFLDVGAFIASKMAQGLPILKEASKMRQPATHIAADMRDHAAMCSMFYEGVTDPETAMLSATAQQLFALPVQHMDVSATAIKNAEWSETDSSRMVVTAANGSQCMLASIAKNTTAAPRAEIHNDREYAFLGLCDSDSQYQHMIVEGKTYPYCARMGAQVVCSESDTEEGRGTFESDARTGHAHSARIVINGAMPLSKAVDSESVFAAVADELEQNGPQAGAQMLLESWSTAGLGAASISAPTPQEWAETSTQIGNLIACCHGDGDEDAVNAECMKFIENQHERYNARLVSSKCDALDMAALSYRSKQLSL